MHRLIDEFNRKGVDALVLDLRKNGGGSLTEAISLTGLFIESGPVVQVKDSDGRVQQYDDTDRGIAWRGPLVVMISKFSAASEILAGAIQDYHRGLIVGDSSTHGKGTVQTMMDLGPQLFRISNPPNLGSLKLTVQQFYRPNGDSTQQRGVLSDVVLPSLTDHYDVSEGDLDYPVAFDSIKAVPFRKYDAVYSVNPTTVSTLKENSSHRIEKSPEFAKKSKRSSSMRSRRRKRRFRSTRRSFSLAAPSSTLRSRRKKPSKSTSAVRAKCSSAMRMAMKPEHHARLSVALGQRQSCRCAATSRPAELSF